MGLLLYTARRFIVISAPLLMVLFFLFTLGLAVASYFFWTLFLSFVVAIFPKDVTRFGWWWITAMAGAAVFGWLWLLISSVIEKGPFEPALIIVIVYLTLAGTIFIDWIRQYKKVFKQKEV